jgi:hypothetical protein
MFQSTIRRAMVGVALTVGVASIDACYVDVPPPEIVEDGYQPMYYDGYVVYFDAAGQPYYYAGGRAVWIAPTDPLYTTYVVHYRAYQRSYQRWYARGGYRYRVYRRR